MRWIVENWQSLAWSAGVLVLAVGAGLVAHRIVFATLTRLARRTSSQIDDAIAARLRAPLRLLVPLLAVQLVASSLRLPPSALAVLARGTSLAFIATVAWLCTRGLHVAEAAVLTRYPEQIGGDLTARRVTTQLHILRRVLSGVVVTVAGAIMLLMFPPVRAVGASLLASAGLAALVAGVALRPAVANVIAGIQIAVSRPINIEDVVVVEGEWGRIEEITLTNVVVRIWDLRRLVLPISYFTEKPFQNWTRGSAEIIGTVFVHADYRVPVEAVRQELQRILTGNPRWDGKTAALQVTTAGERTIELRALVSAADASTAWDLRCEVREKLVEFLQREYPESLPRRRSEQGPLGEGAPDAGRAPGAPPAAPTPASPG